MHIRIVIFTAVLLSPPLAFAAPPEGETRRAPWEWTDEDRFAALMDDEAAVQRVAADRERQKRGPMRAESSSRQDTQPFVDVIDGKRDPHLFFPIDVFAHFVGLAYSDNANIRVAYRQSKERERHQFGLPDDIWDRLEGIVAAYRAAELDDRADAKSNKGTDVSGPTTITLCRERHDALIEAQTTFGPKFTEFLYSAVAPHMRRSFLRRPDARLLSAARGECRW